MRAVDLIGAKRCGLPHTPAELHWLISEYVAGRVPDYQMAAWLMAVCFQGLDREETFALTQAMVESGEIVDLSDIAPVIADKHSTGGVGDKVSIALGPLVAACGVPFAKMSGRGLGHTGGTIDKLESIPGFRTDLTSAEFRSQVIRTGVVIAGQSPTLVPADRLLYALRDVTATVEQESLIASSVMSKKIAAGATAIVLDVKVGEGAFLREREQAHRVARTMIELGKDAGRSVRAVLTAMDEPLGLAVGNALEVREAFEVLHGRGPADLRHVVITLAAHLLLMAGQAGDLSEGRALALGRVQDGSALRKAREWVQGQGGHADVVDGNGLPEARLVLPARAAEAGWVHSVTATTVARAGLLLGAGRETKGVGIDHAVGVVLAAPTGSLVDRGDVVAWIHANEEQLGREAVELVSTAFRMGPDAPPLRGIVIDAV
ncbi:MAG: thymidine phosphorylase [Actinobacteria bacterium]|nr:thymidine phosphorylase [Actinomycetota bacterium]